MAHLTEPLLRADGTVVCSACAVADRPVARLRGLLGRRALGMDEGLLIRPASSIHTFFMRFPIDAVFLSRNGEVLKVASNVAPWRMRSCRKAYAVLELAAGEAERRDVAVGDHIQNSHAEG